ncbi:hypothetical protein ACIPSJ_27155 [Streptomyces sp. NPDC090088]|uniref:hypothetical protein n=1 Tax=Streptomyces sp. NPDC090088 TaxID=3365944 RepID=UPI0038158E6A
MKLENAPALLQDLVVDKAADLIESEESRVEDLGEGSYRISTVDGKKYIADIHRWTVAGGSP